MTFTFEEKTMRKLRLLCASVALTLLLSVSALADGIIQMGKDNPPPPPPPPAAATVQSAPADTGGIIEAGLASTDPLTNAALGLVQSVLALF
jgi:hypothetical protein